MKKAILDNKEIKWGSGILSVYFMWAMVWIIVSSLIKGTPASPYLPMPDIKMELLTPFTNTILGTDIYGRSLVEVISTGLTYSLAMAISISILAATIGTILGYLSARSSATFRFILDLIINLTFIFPSILIAIMIMSVSGQSLLGLVFALVITGWPGYARIVRGETQRVLGLSYVESAKAVGMGEFRLFFRIILPAIIPQLLIHIVLGISGVIMSESALGFLGLGGSEYSWGSLLSMAKSVLLEAPHLVTILSFAMAGLIIGLNLLGDGLRDYLDPKAK